MTTDPAPGGPLRSHGLSAPERKRVIEAARGGSVHLVWRSADGALRIEMLDGERSRTIGRRPTMDVVIDDARVSGLHARLECHNGEWSLVDDGPSKNGTFVDEVRVLARARLVDGCLIRLGTTLVAFKAPSVLEIAPTSPAGERSAIAALTSQQRVVLVALCRPLLDDLDARMPATNKQIAAELHLSVGAVKMHLRGLFARFELEGLEPNKKRLALATGAIEAGTVGRRDVAPGV